MPHLTRYHSSINYNCTFILPKIREMIVYNIEDEAIWWRTKSKRGHYLIITIL
jgi:hypothetical protein